MISALISTALGAVGISRSVAIIIALATAVTALSGLVGWHVIAKGNERREAVAAARKAGEDAERATWQAVVDEERRRQAAANAAAQAAAIADVETLRGERDRLAKQLEDLDNESTRDPDGSKPALSADSVRRIDAIR